MKACINCFYFNDKENTENCRAIVSVKKGTRKTTTPYAFCDLWKSTTSRDWSEAVCLALAYIEYVKDHNVELHREANGSVFQKELPVITIEQYLREVLNEMPRMD